MSSLRCRRWSSWSDAGSQSGPVRDQGTSHRRPSGPHIGGKVGAHILPRGVASVLADTGSHRADGLQPKTIETFRQMRLADPLLQRGVRVYDIAFWRSTADEPLQRLGREVHYPPVIDVLDPYILLVHQGMVETLFIEDMKKRGVEVKRNCAFESYSACDSLMSKKVGAALQINTRVNVSQDKRTILAQYLVGCESMESRPICHDHG